MNQNKAQQLQTAKVISFDLDGTILQRDFDYQLWGEPPYEQGTLWEFVGRHTGMTPQQAYADALQSISAVPLGRVDIRAWIQHYNLPSSEQEIIDAVPLIPSIYDDYPGVIPHLRALNKRIILITESAGYLLEKKLDLAGIRNHFDKVYSTVDKWRKEKDVELYFRVLTEEGIQNTAMVHIGDSMSKDILPCQEVGIPALYIPTQRSRPSMELSTEEQLTSLQEIMEVLTHG